MRVRTFKVTEEGWEALRRIRDEIIAAGGDGLSLLIRCALYEYLRWLGRPEALSVLAPGDDCSVLEELRAAPGTWPHKRVRLTS